mmetsp:Transcript_10095/g.33391  ORF Transcript_10095/g.33391 Transcript_10095/m.33391 type:complete len:358 (+) Transcript_10095:2472-3545(+)
MSSLDKRHTRLYVLSLSLPPSSPHTNALSTTKYHETTAPCSSCVSSFAALAPRATSRTTLSTNAEISLTLDTQVRVEPFPPEPCLSIAGVGPRTAALAITAKVSRASALRDRPRKISSNALFRCNHVNSQTRAPKDPVTKPVTISRHLRSVSGSRKTNGALRYVRHRKLTLSVTARTAELETSPGSSESSPGIVFACSISPESEKSDSSLPPPGVSPRFIFAFFRCCVSLVSPPKRVETPSRSSVASSRVVPGWPPLRSRRPKLASSSFPPRSTRKASACMNKKYSASLTLASNANFKLRRITASWTPRGMFGIAGTGGNRTGAGGTEASSGLTGLGVWTLPWMSPTPHFASQFTFS